jgi:hypothetical protein
MVAFVFFFGWLFGETDLIPEKDQVTVYFAAGTPLLIWGFVMIALPLWGVFVSLLRKK